MSLKIKESELKDILAEVAEDLAKAFESEKDKLAKADGDAPPSKEETPGEDHSGSPPAEGSEGSDAPPAADASASGPGEAPAPGPDASPAPQGMDPAADQAAALTPEALQAEYSKLSPEELDMHIKAALAAKAAVAGAMPDAGAMPPPDMSAGAPAGAPPAPPAASPSPSPLAQSEKGEQLPPSPERKGKNSIDSLGKSEFEAFGKAQNEKIEKLEALVKNQSDEIEALTKIAKLIVEQPLRKAVTSVAHVPKVEESKRDFSNLTKADVEKHLRKLSSSPLTKAEDRRLINDFYDGVVKADALAPLFENYK